MLILATAISGSGRKEYLEKFEEYAKRHGKKVKIYHVGDLIFEHAAKIGVHITPENVLNANPHVISAVKAAVFEDILNGINRDIKKYDAVIVSIHGFFYWKKFFRRAYDYFYLNQLSPDLFVTFIEDGDKILNRLNAREQWKSEKLTLHEILVWQNIEVEMTASLAEFQRKKFYAIPSAQPLSTLYKLAFAPQFKPIYISMPLTHAKDPKHKVKVDKFIEKLEKYFTVFDPRTIEINASSIKEVQIKKDHETNYHHTVLRDLYWLIRQSEKVIAFYPQNVSSPGVINELREAFETNKDVWLIYPEPVASPFLTYFCGKIFASEKQFFNFLDKELKLKKSK